MSYQEKEDEATIKYYVVELTAPAILAESALNSIRTVFDPLMVNLNATGNGTKTELEQKLEKVQTLVVEANKLDRYNQKKLTYLGEILNILGIFKKVEEQTENLPQLNRDFIKAKESLKVDLEKILKSFCDYIIAGFQEYWNSISIEKQQKGKEQYDRIMSLKIAQNLKKTFILFNFFEIDDSSEENQ